MSIKTLVMPAVGLLMIVSSLPATAQSRADRQTRVIRIKHAELMTDAGRARIHNRIAYAAEALCRLDDGRLTLLGRAFDECRDQAIADAHRQLAVRVAAATGRTELATIAADSVAR